MSRHKKSTLSGLVGSDSEDDHFAQSLLTPDSAAEKKTVGIKARGRAKAGTSMPPKAAKTAKVTKTKAPARRVSGRLSGRVTALPKAAATKKPKKQTAAERKAQEAAEDTEEVDEFDQSEDVVMGGLSGDELDESTIVATKEKKPRATKKKAVVPRGKAAKVVPSTQEVVTEPEEVPETKPTRGRKKNPVLKRLPIVEVVEPSKIIMESQVPDVEISQLSVEDEEEQMDISRLPRAPRDFTDPRSRQTPVRRRGGSASDPERNNDPALRRKLGDITKKYDNLSVKYQDLREVGLKEAERNFERLQKNMSEKTNNANKLIASLQADLTSQTALAKEARVLKKKLHTQEQSLAALQAELLQTTKSLTEARSENTTLTAKLTANRKAAASYEAANSKTPGSSIKTNGGIRMMGTAEAAQVAKAAQLKEHLYSDLTGLIVVSAKQEADDDVFDCIQTGRNGTLHFKLSIAHSKDEELDCSYTPQLDPSRDRALLDLLPDFLVDEIEFPRDQAARFYARVSKALTEKPVEQERPTSAE